VFPVLLVWVLTLARPLSRFPMNPFITKFARRGFTECVTFVERIVRVARGFIYTVTERGTAPTPTCSTQPFYLRSFPAYI
jgi:hypothetical protein